jgi:hypothetical protein
LQRKKKDLTPIALTPIVQLAFLNPAQQAPNPIRSPDPSFDGSPRRRVVPQTGGISDAPPFRSVQARGQLNGDPVLPLIFNYQLHH